jgi:hypothetical protein
VTKAGVDVSELPAEWAGPMVEGEAITVAV